MKCAFLVLATGGITLLLVLILMWPSWDLIVTGKNDFLSFYAGGRLLFHSDIYDAAAVQELQRGTANAESDTLPFIRLPYYALGFHALSRLSYEQAYLIWQLLNVSALIGFVILTPAVKRCGLVVATSCSVPILMSFANGQDLPMMLLFWSLSGRLLGQRRDFAAGLCLSLCVAKFHLFAVVPVVVLVQRRWRFCMAAMMGISLLLGLSSFLTGPDWPMRYAHVLTQANLHHPSVLSPNAAGILKSLLLSPYWLWLIAVVTVALVIVVSRRLSFGMSLAAALLAGVLIAPHCFLQDLSLLLPACWTLFEGSTRELTKTTSFLLLTPLLYLAELAMPPPASSLLPVTIAVLLSSLLFLAPQPPARCADSARLR